jgi:hypothetical protein
VAGGCEEAAEHLHPRTVISDCLDSVKKNYTIWQGVGATLRALVGVLQQVHYYSFWGYLPCRMFNSGMKICGMRYIAVFFQRREFQFKETQ